MTSHAQSGDGALHPNAILIRKLYESLDRHDSSAMLECYAADAQFRDIAFDLHGLTEIGAMWRMITSGDIRATIESIEANDARGSARLVDEYTFRETGRRVRNVIDSTFRFQNGRIAKHQDECDAHAWGAMALGGVTGFIAGRLRFVRAWRARALLREFQRQTPSETKVGKS